MVRLGWRCLLVGLVALAVFPIRQGDVRIVLEMPLDSAVGRATDEECCGCGRAGEFYVSDDGRALNLVCKAIPGGVNAARSSRVELRAQGRAAEHEEPIRSPLPQPVYTVSSKRELEYRLLLICGRHWSCRGADGARLRRGRLGLKGRDAKRTDDEVGVLDELVQLCLGLFADTASGRCLEE